MTNYVFANAIDDEAGTLMGEILYIDYLRGQPDCDEPSGREAERQAALGARQARLDAALDALFDGCVQFDYAACA